VSREPLVDPQQRVGNFAHLDPEYVFPTGSMQAAGGAYDWLERALLTALQDLGGLGGTSHHTDRPASRRLSHHKGESKVQGHNGQSPRLGRRPKEVTGRAPRSRRQLEGTQAVPPFIMYLCPWWSKGHSSGSMSPS
jgi:hypothetical protein